jgi:hypothetical protein
MTHLKLKFLHDFNYLQKLQFFASFLPNMNQDIF